MALQPLVGNPNLTPPGNREGDLAAALAEWRSWLADERRVSPRTLAAYRSDVDAFLGFLAGHLGASPTPARLAALVPADLRAWLAHLANRGRRRTSIARGMASVRSFCRFLDRRHIAHVAPAFAVRTPKLPHMLPRPLSADEALAVVESADVPAAAPWIAARDVALFSLLYGCDSGSAKPWPCHVVPRR